MYVKQRASYVRIKAILKSRKFVYVMIVVMIPGISAVAYSLINSSVQRSEPDNIPYGSITEALKDRIGPDLTRQYEGYYSALNLYQRDEFIQAGNVVEGLLKTGVGTELEPGVYALAYNIYIKQNQLENAKNTVIEYQKTESYSNLADETKKSWIDTLTALNKGEVPSDSSGSESDE